MKTDKKTSTTKSVKVPKPTNSATKTTPTSKESIKSSDDCGGKKR